MNRLALVLLTGTVLLTACSRHDETPLSRAERHFSRGHWDETILACDDIIRAEPENAAHYVLRGRAQAGRGAAELALQDFTKAIQVNPGSAEAYYYREIAYRKLGQMDEAFADARRARELDVKYGTAYAFETPEPTEASVAQMLRADSSDAASNETSPENIDANLSRSLGPSSHSEQVDASPLSLPRDPGGVMLQIPAVAERRPTTGFIDIENPDDSLAGRWFAERRRLAHADLKRDADDDLAAESLGESAGQDGASSGHQPTHAAQPPPSPRSFRWDRSHGNAWPRPWSADSSARPTGLLSNRNPSGSGAPTDSAAIRPTYVFQPGSGLPNFVPPLQDTSATTGSLSASQAIAGAGSATQVPGHGLAYGAGGALGGASLAQPDRNVSRAGTAPYYAPMLNRNVRPTGINSRDGKP